MHDPFVGIKDLIDQARTVALALGSEPLDGIGTTRDYCDAVLFISIDEMNDRVWVAVPIWDEETQEIVWKAVLDVPEDGFPERFLTTITPEHGDLAWVDYLEQLHGWIDEQSQVVQIIANQRYLRRLLGDLRIDIHALIADLVRLRRMGLKAASPLISLLHRLLEVDPQSRHLLLEMLGA